MAASGDFSGRLRGDSHGRRQALPVVNTRSVEATRVQARAAAADGPA
jgi:hypothetical protein